MAVLNPGDTDLKNRLHNIQLNIDNAADQLASGAYKSPTLAAKVQKARQETRDLSALAPAYEKAVTAYNKAKQEADGKTVLTGKTVDGVFIPDNILPASAPTLQQLIEGKDGKSVFD